MIINGLIIFIAKIFGRELYIKSHSLKFRWLAYAIIVIIALSTASTFFYLLRLSAVSESNISLIAKATKNWQLADHLEAAGLNEVKLEPAKNLIIYHLPINPAKKVETKPLSKK